MKQGTLDNLIYLSCGLGIAALVVVDSFYSDSRGREMWWPSEFEFHVAFYTILLGYFVAAETRKVGATWTQIVACVLAGSIMHVGIAFGFRQTYAGPLSLRLLGLALLEFFIIVRLMVQVVRYLGSTPDGRGGPAV